MGSQSTPAKPTSAAATTKKGERNDVDAAERALLAGNSASTLLKKFNLGPFEKLCEKYKLEVAGPKAELVKRLIAWVRVHLYPGNESTHVLR